MNLLRSRDLGRSFQETTSAPVFPADDGHALANIWSFEYGDNPREIWAGVEPASLWRSENGGDPWTKLTNGLPREDSYFTVLRDALDVDVTSNPGLYFGTTNGQVWIGRDGGNRWDCLFDALPRVNCVKAAVV